MKKKLLILSILLSYALLAFSIPTRLTVRAKAKDAKFVGSSIGGALILVKNAQTGELLAKGLTRGSTGNTNLMMRTPYGRWQKLSDDKTARFEALLDIKEPVFISIEAQSPYGKKQATTIVSTQMWLIPGKHIIGDGVVLEIPGFIVDVLSPRTHQFISLADHKEPMLLRANMVMMCGCTISKGGLWDGSSYEVKALVKINGKSPQSIPLYITEEDNIFEGKLSLQEKGIYEVTIYGYDVKTGNTGVDKVSFVVE